MASPQVLPNSASSSRKQGHLEAGKRRLEEFRKKKAEGRARKPASTGQQQVTDANQNVTQIPESGSKRPVDVDGAAASERDEPLGKETANDNKEIDSSNTTELGSSSGNHLFDGNYNASYADQGQKLIKDLPSKQYQTSDLYINYNRQEEDNNSYPSAYNGTQEKKINTIDQPIPCNIFHGIESSDGNFSSDQIQEDENHLKEDSGTSHASVTGSFEKHHDSVKRDAGFASTSTSGNGSAVLNEDVMVSTTSLAEPLTRAEQSNGPISSGFSYDYRGSSNHTPLNSVTSESSTWRNRPSFLDSLNVSRVSPFTHSPFTQPEKADSFMSGSSKAHGADMLASSTFGKSFTNDITIGSFEKSRSPHVPDMHDRGIDSVSLSTEDKMQSQGFNRSVMEWNHEVPTVKQDENFAALEQHIEDLTQEKFSLKRDLDASRALAESLATENSSLTDSYNQQRAAVNQLKADMESLREEINAQLLELDSVKMEYANAQLECNAADERAKILASEVIGLEEKALKLRSSELKLERQLENSNAEIASYKKKVSSLQKERQDLQFTIDALQEEKKLLQSKLRKAAGNVKSVEVIKTPPVVKNVSTSTEDLGFDVSDLARGMDGNVDTVQSTSNEIQSGAVFSSGTSSTSQLPETQHLHFSVAFAAIPPDQSRMIGNINSLISELALEKEELMRALSSESSNSSKLKEMNKDLSRKLEAQTQRLELLTAQSMASENIQGRPTDSRPTHESIAYTDEGDEVVERVLGWIMKLFPGGPSKRRTKRLL